MAPRRRAEGARQLLKTLKKKDALSQTRRKRFWPSPRPTPSYNATTRHRKRDVLRQSTQSLVFRCLGVAAELWRRFNLLRERSLLGMLVLAFALGRATLSPTKRDPFHKKRRWSALLYLLLKWLCVVFSLRAVLRDPSLNRTRIEVDGRAGAAWSEFARQDRRLDRVQHGGRLAFWIGCVL